MKRLPASAPDIAVCVGLEGVLYLEDRRRLPPSLHRLTDALDYWADHAPSRPFLVERDQTGAWVPLTYADARSQARAIAQALIDRQLSVDRPVLILSGNSIEHALLALAAMYAGVLYAPISPAYSLQSRDHATLAVTLELMRPGLVFAADAVVYGRALDRLQRGVEIVASTAPRVAS